MAKMTKREQFVEVATVLEGLEGTEALVEFIDHEISLIDKRKSAPRKATPAQLENESLKVTIVDILSEVDEGRTATDVANGLGVSVQKASQLLRQLVAEGQVSKTEAHGKTKATFAV